MKARSLLLMCWLSLAGAAAADPIGGPRHSLDDGWLFEPPPEGYDLRDGVPHTAAPQPRQDAAIIPLPRPRPNVPETSGAIQDDALNPGTPAPPPAPMPQPTPFAADAGVGSTIQVKASGEAMSKVLDDLSKVIDLRYRASIPLDATVNATYSGSAEKVVTRLLSDYGYGFAISHRGEVMEVSVYGRWPP